MWSAVPDPDPNPNPRRSLLPGSPEATQTAVTSTEDLYSGLTVRDLI